MVRKIIFLDADGVLLPPNAKAHFSHNIKKLKEKLSKNFDTGLSDIDAFDIATVVYDWHPIAIENIKFLIKKTGAGIVFCSHLNKKYSLNQIRLLFKIFDLHFSITDTIIYQADDNRTLSDKIKSYLRANPDIEKFVVLNCVFEEEIKQNFPKNYICPSDFLSNTDVSKAIEILL